MWLLQYRMQHLGRKQMLFNIWIFSIKLSQFHNRKGKCHQNNWCYGIWKERYFLSSLLFSNYSIEEVEKKKNRYCPTMGKFVRKQGSKKHSQGHWKNAKNLSWENDFCIHSMHLSGTVSVDNNMQRQCIYTVIPSYTHIRIYIYIYLDTSTHIHMHSYIYPIHT